MNYKLRKRGEKWDELKLYSHYTERHLDLGYRRRRVQTRNTGADYEFHEKLANTCENVLWRNQLVIFIIHVVFHTFLLVSIIP